MSCMKQVIDVMELLDDSKVDGEAVKKFFKEYDVEVSTVTLKGSKGKTDLIKIVIPGEREDKMPTLGIVGRLGGVGVRPKFIGMVSDADGAIIALASALKIGMMRHRGDILEGNVIITTHISPSSPTSPHKPVPFVIPPVDFREILRNEVDSEMDAILSVDATKGNRIIKVDGFAITPTVKNGWILKVSDDLIDIYEKVVGDVVSVVPITMQDITPYEDHIYHINSIMLPWLATQAPVAGVATTARVPVAGSGTGANYIVDLEKATRFIVEVAKDFTSNRCRFYDEDEYHRLIRLYGEVGDKFRRE